MCVISWLSKKKYKDTDVGGSCSILLCIYNELMKTDTFTPTQLFRTRQDTNVIPKLFALQLRPLWLKERDSRGRVKKNTPWCSLTLLKIQHHASVNDRALRFSRRAQLPWRAHEVSLYKRPVYMSYCREDIIKKSGYWADYTHAASTPEMIYI